MGATQSLPALATAALAAVVAYHWRHAVGSHRPPASTPVAPGALPLLGNGLQILRHLPRIHDWIAEQRAAVGAGGATFAMTQPLMPAIFVASSPSVLEWVLRTNAGNYVKGENFRRNFGPLLGKGIFVSDGEEWRWQRKLAARMFSVKGFKLYVSEVFGAKADLLLERLAAACPGGDPGAAARLGVAPGAAVDLQDLMYRFTLDTFARIGFGTDPGCLTTPGRLAFAEAFDRAQRTTNARFWMPLWPLLEALVRPRPHARAPR
jgi:cytochrome P450